MKYYIPLLFIILFLSCNHTPRRIVNKSDNEGIEEYEINSYSDDYNPLIGVDSIALMYWMTIDANKYKYTYSIGNKQITITCPNLQLEKHINDSLTLNNFLYFIDSFFISKSELIEITRSKSDPIVTDYSRITIELFLNSKLIHKETIQYGEEGYDIEYNPKFVEFYSFLDNLVPTPKS